MSMSEGQDAARLSAFRERLREAIAEEGLTQAELAQRLGVRQATVSQWLSDRAPAQPKVAQLLQLPDALEVSGHWLLTGEGSMRWSPNEAIEILDGIRDLIAGAGALTPEDAVAARTAARAYQEMSDARTRERSRRVSRRKRGP